MTQSSKNINIQISVDARKQLKLIKERLKKAEKNGAFLDSEQVDKIVASFKP